MRGNWLLSEAVHLEPGTLWPVGQARPAVRPPPRAARAVPVSQTPGRKAETRKPKRGGRSALRSRGAGGRGGADEKTPRVPDPMSTWPSVFINPGKDGYVMSEDESYPVLRLRVLVPRHILVPKAHMVHGRARPPPRTAAREHAGIAPTARRLVVELGLAEADDGRRGVPNIHARLGQKTHARVEDVGHRRQEFLGRGDGQAGIVGEDQTDAGDGGEPQRVEEERAWLGVG